MAKFIHVADVHLDSPLGSLRRLDSGTAQRLQRASRRSLETVVTTALEHQVAAVIVAGDLFDGPVKDAGAGLWVEGQFKRLTRAGIRIVLIRGNHDAISNARKVSQWSDGIDDLGSDQPRSVILDSDGLAIHGQSFGARVESNDLAATYPLAKPGYCNIGVLHTSLSGSVAHDTYAPTSLAVLESKDYAYWALGHIHARTLESLSPKCYVGYSGNTQGRHIRELGAKGCQLVHVSDANVARVEFVATDSLRWHELQVDVQSCEHLADIDDLVSDASAELLEAADGRPLVVRVRIVGPTRLHAELSRTATVEQLSDMLASRLADISDIWLESVRVASQPAEVSSREELLLPLKYLCEVTQQIREDENVQTQMLEQLEPLMRRARVELSAGDWPLEQPALRQAEFLRLLRRAEDLIVARLSAES